MLCNPEEGRCRPNLLIMGRFVSASTKWHAAWVILSQPSDKSFCLTAWNTVLALKMSYQKSTTLCGKVQAVVLLTEPPPPALHQMRKQSGHQMRKQNYPPPHLSISSPQSQMRSQMLWNSGRSSLLGPDPTTHRNHEHKETVWSARFGGNHIFSRDNQENVHIPHGHSAHTV